MNDSLPEHAAWEQFTRIIDRARDGGATVISRDGTPVAAVVSMDDFAALEDAIDEYFAREAEAAAETEAGQPRYSLAEILAEVHGTQPRSTSHAADTHNEAGPSDGRR